MQKARAEQVAKDPLSHRSFLRKPATDTVGAIIATNFPFVAAGAPTLEPIRVAVIGYGSHCCGSSVRGGSAALNATEAAPDVKVVAFADFFEQELGYAREMLRDFPTENCFTGLDSYQKALAVPGVNYVIVAAPPGFRPMHLRAAVEAGKHVFVEQPVAVDAPGVRSVIESGEIAKRKGLSIVAGTVRRHQPGCVETIKRIQEGAVGEILYLRAYWDQGRIWWYRDEDLSKSEMERALRNWYSYRWLSGDNIVERHTQNLDVCNWAMGNQHPIRAYGQGGRQALGNKPGHTWDHFAVEFEYENGARLFSQCRQISGPVVGTAKEYAHGTKGYSNCESWIETKEGTWRFPGRISDPWVLEHADLINAIRSGKPLNEARTIAESTLTAIMGREAAYSGRVVEWDQIFHSTVSLFPEKLEWGPIPKLEVPIPGQHIPG